MTEPTHPDHLAAWPALLAQLDEDQYGALCLVFSALLAGDLAPEDLVEVAASSSLTDDENDGEIHCTCGIPDPGDHRAYGPGLSGTHLRGQPEAPGRSEPGPRPRPLRRAIPGRPGLAPQVGRCSRR
jgi:hypothetical protein